MCFSSKQSYLWPINITFNQINANIMKNIMNMHTKINSSVCILNESKVLKFNKKNINLAILLLNLYYHSSTGLIVIIGLFHYYFTLKIPLNNEENMHLYQYLYHTSYCMWNMSHLDIIHISQISIAFIHFSLSNMKKAFQTFYAFHLEITVRSAFIFSVSLVLTLSQWGTFFWWDNCFIENAIEN